MSERLELLHAVNECNGLLATVEAPKLHFRLPSGRHGVQQVAWSPQKSLILRFHARESGNPKHLSNGNSGRRVGRRSLCIHTGQV